MSDGPAIDSSNRELFINRRRTVAAAVLLSCFSALSWRSVLQRAVIIHHGVSFFGLHFSHDPIRAVVLPLGALVAASAALNSRLRLDRFVFGIGSACMVVASLREFLSLSRSQVVGLEGAEGIAWAIAAVICVTAFIRWKTVPDE